MRGLRRRWRESSLVSDNTLSLQSIADIKQGRYVAKSDMAEHRAIDTPIPVHGANGIIGWTSEAMYEFGVPLVTCRGSNSGMVLWADGPLWVSNNAMAILPYNENRKFAYYALLNDPPFETVSGSAQPQITRSSLGPRELFWPDDDEQLSIVELLSQLDSKIELNRRMNATLEAMAQAIFRDWFVDFGPVHRKSAGETESAAILGGLIPHPEKAAPTAALFPDNFGDDGLPEGWERKSIYDISEVKYGAPFKSKLFNENCDGRPLARIRDLPKQKGGQYTTEIHSRETLIQPGDVVVGMDGEFRAYVWQGVETLMNQRICMFKPSIQRNRAFVYQAIKPWLKHFEDSAIATTVIHLGKRDIDWFDYVDPGRSLMREFGELVEPMMSKTVSNGQENDNLAETRDYLLPRLMSGEVRVADAERMVR